MPLIAALGYQLPVLPNTTTNNGNIIARLICALILIIFGLTGTIVATTILYRCSLSVKLHEKNLL